jgi:hypothetical protein
MQIASAVASDVATRLPALLFHDPRKPELAYLINQFVFWK